VKLCLLKRGGFVKKLLIALAVILLSTAASAQFYDSDGHLNLNWSQPESGNPVASYIISYTINGVPDSIVSATSALSDNSVILAVLGDSCSAHLRAVSIFNDTSVVVISPTAYFATTGIGAPVGPLWSEDPLPIQTQAIKTSR
jgi:hypothetical protein